MEECDEVVGLGARAAEAVDAFWAKEVGCAPGDFELEGVGVVERPALDGSEYVQLFRRKRRLQITCSASLASTVREMAATTAHASLFDVDVVRSALAGRVDRIVGPAYLGYLDAVEPARDARVRLLETADAALDGLRRDVSEVEWEHGGLEHGQPIAGFFADGVLLAAAGYEVWGGRIAHIGVVTREGARGAGRGRACVGAIASHAIARGLIAQYRTLYANRGAMGIARALAFVDYGATIYVAAT